MKKISVDVLSHATMAPAQGVASVFLELQDLFSEFGKDDFDFALNKHGKYDLYHIHSVNPDFYFMMRKDRTTICFVHFLPDTLEGSIRLPKRFYGDFRKYVVSFYKKAKEIVVVNPSFIPELEKLGITRDKITFIPNFVSEKNFYPLSLEKKNSIREAYGIKKDAFVVLCVGQVQPRKGVLDFLKLSEDNPDITFVWAGGFSFKKLTDDYDRLEKEMKKKRKNVVFLGIVDREKMNEVYNMADLFLLPSYNELFPMALLEACACGLPYVVRDLDLYHDVLEGDYLRASNLEQFSEVIGLLKSDNSKVEETKALSTLMNEKYNRQAIYKIWKEYYIRIAKKYSETD